MAMLQKGVSALSPHLIILFLYIILCYLKLHKMGKFIIYTDIIDCSSERFWVCAVQALKDWS